MDAPAIFEARREVLGVHLSEGLERYLVELVLATRTPARYGGELARWNRVRREPARQHRPRPVRARPMRGSTAATTSRPHDVQAIAHDVLRHRVLLTFDAEAEGIDSDHVVETLLSRVAVP